MTLTTADFAMRDDDPPLLTEESPTGYLFDLMVTHGPLTLTRDDIFILVADAAGKPLVAIDAEIEEMYTPRKT